MPPFIQEVTVSYSKATKSNDYIERKPLVNGKNGTAQAALKRYHESGRHFIKAVNDEKEKRGLNRGQLVMKQVVDSQYPNAKAVVVPASESGRLIDMKGIEVTHLNDFGARAGVCISGARKTAFAKDNPKGLKMPFQNIREELKAMGCEELDAPDLRRGGYKDVMTFTFLHPYLDPARPDLWSKMKMQKNKAIPKMSAYAQLEADMKKEAKARTQKKASGNKRKRQPLGLRNA